jgi:hypothetical protein
MVADNFLCSAAVAFFWFTDLRARLGHARIANHRGRCPPDRISRPHMGWECVGPASAVHLRQPVGSTFTHLFVRADVFGPHLTVWVGPLEMPSGPWHNRGYGRPFSVTLLVGVLSCKSSGVPSKACT